MSAIPGGSLKRTGGSDPRGRVATFIPTGPATPPNSPLTRQPTPQPGPLLNGNIAPAPSRRRSRTTGRGRPGTGARPDRHPRARVLIPATDVDRDHNPHGRGRRADHPSRPDQALDAATAPTTPARQVAPTPAPERLIRSVLICDDRVDARRELSQSLRLG